MIKQLRDDSRRISNNHELILHNDVHIQAKFHHIGIRAFHHEVSSIQWLQLLILENKNELIYPSQRL
ncbi:hypothetical protein Gotur_001498 [Gossypium turneri]